MILTRYLIQFRGYEGLPTRQLQRYLIQMFHSIPRFLWHVYQSLKALRKKVRYAYSFDPKISLNYLFYEIQNINLRAVKNKYKPTTIGDGKFQVNKIFWITPLVSRIYGNLKWKLPLFMVPLSFILSSFLDLHVLEIRNILFFSILISSNISLLFTFYTMNYQCIGWVLNFFALLFFLHNQVTLGLLIYALTFYLTFTPALLAFPIFMAVLSKTSWLSLFIILMSVAFVIIHRIFKGENISFGVKTAKATLLNIGFSRKKALYKRAKPQINHLFLWQQISILLFIISIVSTKSIFPYIFLSIYLIIIPIFPEMGFRLFDKEMILYAQIFVISIYNFAFNFVFLTFIALWMFLNPPLGLLGLNSFNKRKNELCHDRIEPFDFSFIIEKLSMIADKVTDDSVMVALNNPRHSYEDIYGNFSPIIVALNYIFTLRSKLFIPDLYLVADGVNNPLRPIWINSVNDFFYSGKYWNTRFFLIIDRNDFVAEFKNNQNFQFLGKCKIELPKNINFGSDLPPCEVNLVSVRYS